jgi:rubrerythrin
MHSKVIKMNVAVEYAALPATIAILKDIPQEQHDLRSSIIKWVHDENKHAYILNEYSSRFLKQDMVDIEFEQIAIDFSPAMVSVPASLTMHLCTELTTIRWYKKMIEWHEEPLIKSIYKNILIDEANHANMFRKFLKQNITKETMKEVLGIFQLFMTKKHFISIKLASTTTIDKQTIHSRLPEPELFDHFLNNILNYNEQDIERLNKSLLKIASEISDQQFDTINDLKVHRKTL